MKTINFTAINNPREKNGDFGPLNCSMCEKYSGAYVFIHDMVEGKMALMCKGCLLRAVDLIDKTILQDAVEKGKERCGK